MIDALQDRIPLSEYGFTNLGAEQVKLVNGSTVTEGRFSYRGDQLRLKFYTSPLNNNGDDNWYKWGEIFEGSDYRLKRPEDLARGYRIVTPNLYRSLESGQRLVLPSTLSPRLMHLVYTPEEVQVLQESLGEFTQRMVNVDEDRGRIDLRNGVLRIEHRLRQPVRGGDACSLEIDIDDKSRQAFKAGVFPGHILQKEQDHYCIPSKQSPVLPVDFRMVKAGFEVLIDNNYTPNRGRDMSDERFAELFAGLPLPGRFLIWFREKQYTPVVGIEGGIHLSSRLFYTYKGDGYQYDRCAQDLAASMESFKRLYDSVPNRQRVSS